jgi:hypothetical protein
MLWMGMGGHGWTHVMLWVGMGGHRSMLMVIRVVYCVVTEANLGIMSCRHDIMPDVVFILTDLNFTEFCV